MVIKWTRTYANWKVCSVKLWEEFIDCRSKYQFDLVIEDEVVSVVAYKEWVR